MVSVPSATSRPAVGVLLLFALTIFLSAWLLFQIQPMFAKMALPLLGGSPAVWNTALVFFQAVLLLGYLYAHGLVSRVALRWQVFIHIGVLGAAFIALPVAIGESWRSPPEEMPILWLIALLAVSVGLPFFAVSANSPLLQGWFARTGHARAQDPYFLYGASNLGSMLVLLAYPFLIEPTLHLSDQGWIWTAGFGLLVVLIGTCALNVWRNRSQADPRAQPTGDAEIARVTWRERLHWVALAFVPSGMLVAATTFMTTDLAAVPLLWIVPLTLYLLSFVLVFARKPILTGRWMGSVQAALLAIAALVATWSMPAITYYAVALALATLLATSLVCHGELVRRRPAPRLLTEFYVWMSLGGILGSAFCALLAPLLFDSVVEYAILIVLAGFLRPASGERARSPARFRMPRLAAPVGATLREAALPGLGAVALGALVMHGGSGSIGIIAAVALGMFALAIAVASAFRPFRFGLCLAVLAGLGLTFANAQGHTVVHRERTFFGTHKVLSLEQGRYFALGHGGTIHGVQASDPAHWRDRTAYFHGNAGIGRIFAALEARGREPRRIAVLGLGSGVLACYRKPGQAWSFFEIDPAVVRLARDRRYFHFLSECTPDARVIVGDGRLLLAREPDGLLDFLVADAFSSDSIPMHLYTREAIEIYIRKLAPGGLLLLNVTNRYINVEPALAALLGDAGLAGRIMRSDRPAEGAGSPVEYSSVWVAVARDAALLTALTDAFDNERPSGWGRWKPLQKRPGVQAWTDDYSNLIEAIE